MLPIKINARRLSPPQVGGFDPLTREPLAARQLVRNVALRCAAAAWLDAHPAAYGELVATALPQLPESPKAAAMP